jgi:amino acid permease
MYLFGLGGYAYAGKQTQGNILLNIAHRNDDWMLVLGRVGVGINICVATPMMLLPCRENLLEVVEIVMGKEDQVDVTVIGEQTALLRDEPIQKDPVFYNPLVHYGSTLLIVVLCYVGAYQADSVAVVWSLCGSSMAFLIAFILPAVYYLQIQQREHVPNNRAWVVFCWILLPMACLSAVACTVQTVIRVVFPE